MVGGPGDQGQSYVHTSALFVNLLFKMWLHFFKPDESAVLSASSFVLIRTSGHFRLHLLQVDRWCREVGGGDGWGGGCQSHITGTRPAELRASSSEKLPESPDRTPAARTRTKTRTSSQNPDQDPNQQPEPGSGPGPGPGPAARTRTRTRTRTSSQNPDQDQDQDQDQQPEPGPGPGPGPAARTRTRTRTRTSSQLSGPGPAARTRTRTSSQNPDQDQQPEPGPGPAARTRTRTSSQDQDQDPALRSPSSSAGSFSSASVMAPPQWTTSVLLASLILVLWSASAWSDSSTNPSALTRFKRGQITPATKAKIEKSLDVALKALTIFKDEMSKIDRNTMTTVMKALADFAALAPGIGSAISAVISLVLLFIPTEDKVMKEFAIVNNKLDSISMQISQLNTHVKVSSFLGTYSTNEATIINAWKELEKLNKKPLNDNTQGEIKKFIKYCKDTNVRKDVDNLFHFLTVEGISISENINTLYKEKFKCHVKYMGIYSLYLNDLMLKGMILNQAYLKLSHQSSPGDHTELVNKLKKLYEIQKKRFHECYDSYEKQMETDVVEIAKSRSPDDKMGIAKQVHAHLDDKYDWYNWQVVVYNTKDDKKHRIYNMRKINANTVTVAVTYTLKVSPAEEEIVGRAIRKLSAKCDVKDVERLKDHLITLPSPGVGRSQRNVSLSEYVKIGDVIHRNKDVAEFPKPLHIIKCKNKMHKSVALHVSKKLPVCKPNPCKNSGVCNRLLESNYFLCECQDSSYGDVCEKKVNTNQITEMLRDVPFTVPVGEPPKVPYPPGVRRSRI
ncbi:uncharacterized protein LOC133464832 [Cololabis saira]|uniref:uncharacterized protein LOC133464832 n=1 Tax=Cololabis saira TaxID=129043 RepID=UPI002AD5AEAD|nr:uncharacterized protein LOC133464832 [Cololabis saira]